MSKRHDAKVYDKLDDLTNGFLNRPFTPTGHEMKNLLWNNKKSFTLSDLESGMVVECENGKRYLVVGETLCRHGFYADFNNFNENLSASVHMNSACEDDIIKVFKPLRCNMIDAISDSNKLGELIWQREPEIAELTMSEIAEKFGVDVERLRIKE